MTLLTTAFLLILFPTLNLAEPQNEDAYNRAFCERVGGETEVRHDYTYPTGRSHVRVDCETEDTVYEGGLDKRTSLDSLQQALFFAVLTGKEPAVVLYDTDGQVGMYEYRIRKACEQVGVRFVAALQEEAAVVGRDLATGATRAGLPLPN